jgi:hypothetical protein
LSPASDGHLIAVSDTPSLVPLINALLIVKSAQ